MVFKAIVQRVSSGHDQPKQKIDALLAAKGYTLGHALGQGAYAKVFISEFEDKAKRLSRVPLACKVVDTKTAAKDFVEKFFPREISILHTIQHPNIIRVHSIMKISFKYYIFMSYCENGDLLAFMKEHGAIREGRAKIWFNQLLDGISYLHDKNVVHRDLKCENLFLDGKFTLRIGDFGFARLFKEGDPKSTTFCGSVLYAPPEVVRGSGYNPILGDLWSAGVCLYVMLNKAMPFDENQGLARLYEAQMSRLWKLRSNVKDLLTRELKSFLFIVMEPIPDKRKTPAKLKEEPWLKNSLHLPDFEPQVYQKYSAMIKSKVNLGKGTTGKVSPASSHHGEAGAGVEVIEIHPIPKDKFED